MSTAGMWNGWDWDRKRTVLLVAAGAAMIVDTAGRYLLATAGWQLQPTGLVVAILAAVLGSRSRRGLAVGFFCSGAISGDLTGGVITAFGVFIAVLVWESLWLQFHPGAEWFAWIGQYAAVTVVSVVCLAATVAWFTEALGRMAFWIALQTTIVGNIPLALSGVVVAWPLVAWARDQGWRPDDASFSARRRALVAGTVVIWAVGGYLASFTARAATGVPLRVFGRRLPAVTATVLRVIGPGGRWLLLIVGFLMLAVLAVTISTSQSVTG